MDLTLKPKEETKSSIKKLNEVKFEEERQESIKKVIEVLPTNEQVP